MAEFGVYRRDGRYVITRSVVWGEASVDDSFDGPNISEPFVFGRGRFSRSLGGDLAAVDDVIVSGFDLVLMRTDEGGSTTPIVVEADGTVTGETWVPAPSPHEEQQ